MSIPQVGGRRCYTGRVVYQVQHSVVSDYICKLCVVEDRGVVLLYLFSCNISFGVHRCIVTAKLHRYLLSMSDDILQLGVHKKAVAEEKTGPLRRSGERARTGRGNQTILLDVLGISLTKRCGSNTLELDDG